MKKILVILSEYGYWGEELIGPYEVLTKAGYECVFATPKGNKARPLPPSMDANYVDPPLNDKVTTEEMANKVKALDSSNKLDNPINIFNLMPDRPYLSSVNYLRELEEYYKTLEEIDNYIEQFEAILLIGGSGPIIDMVNNFRVHDLILAFHKAEKPIAAICYGVACLAFARDIRIRESIIKNKHVTGHPVEYDYKYGTGFLNVNLDMGAAPYTLEYILRDAVAPNGKFHGNFGSMTSVIVDYPFITGRSTRCAYLTGQKLVECLDLGLKKFGW
ncbi:MAG: type 1 glutamine amidotransferase domain-containing protein [bacterium]